MQKEGSRKDYDLVGSYDNQRITTINAERTVNLFEYMDPQGKRPKVLLPTAGIDDTGLNFGSETGGSRATFVFNNSKSGAQEIFLVYGSSVFRVTGTTDALAISKVGDFLIGSPPEPTSIVGYVGVDANQYQIIFVDGVKGWIWDSNAETFNIITDTGFPTKPIDVCYLDGFFVVANGGTNTFQLSQINQGMVWSGGSGTTPSATFSADFTSDTLTLSTNNANFATGVAVTLATTSVSANITNVNTGTDILTLNMSNEHFQTGTSLRFSTTGGLPAPLTTTDTFYSIMEGTLTQNPGTIKVATSYANAISGTAIDITTTGSGTIAVNSTSVLPTPLIGNSTAMYYVIQVGGSTGSTIKLATSYVNAIAGIEIDLKDSGSPMNNINVTGQLQLGSITSHPGTIVACNTLHRRIFFFSQNYTEVWENAGQGSNLPFRRNNSLLMEVGTPSIASVSVGFDRMFFLAQDRDGLAGVMEVRGTESMPVSNKALDFQLAQYAATTGVNDARGILIKENGIIFYRLNFTSSNHTFVLNVSMSTVETPKWHEEEILNGNRHPAQTHAYFGGVNYYGDYSQPLFYSVDDASSTNNGESIRRMRIGRQMTPEGYNRLRIDRFQVDLLHGAEDIETSSSLVEVDLLTELEEIITTESTIDIILEDEILVPSMINGGNPIVFLQISKDGGQTYGNYITATMGKIGERTHRTVWRKLGTTPRGQGFTPKIEFFNQIPFVVLGAAWDFEDLPE